MPVTLNNLSIGRKLTLAFGVLTLLVATLATVVFISLSRLETADFWNTHTYEALDQASAMLDGMINQETGLRGFLVGGEAKFLELYNAGFEQFKTAFDKAKSLTADNAAQQERLERLKAAALSWRNDIAEREIALMKDPNTREQARAMEASGAGKTAMDGFRALQAEMKKAEGSLLAVRSAQKQAAASLARWVMIAGGLAVSVLSLTFAWLLTRSVSRPISGMTSAMTRLAGGDNGVEIAGAERKDEIGAMAQAVDVFKRNAIERRQAEAEAAQARAAADAEREKAAAERARIAEAQSAAMNALKHGLKQLADGDLLVRLDKGFTGEFAEVRDDFNAAASKLRATLAAVVNSAGTIHSSTREISSASDNLSQRTEQQAASLEETAAALEEITMTVKTSAQGAQHAAEVAATADADAKKGAVVVRQAVEAMDAIAESSNKIGQIIGVIDEIAFQTNLLALNAGVEAARAGDSGKGFAVVASEVRALAQRSAEAAREIKALVSASGAQVENGVQLVAQSGKALESIIAQVSEINKVVADIASGAQQQATGLQQINAAIGQMDQSTQQNATMVEESTAASHSLSQEMTELSKLVEQFRVSEAGEDRLRRDLKTVAPHVFAKPAAPPRAVAKRALREAPRLVAKAAGSADWAEF
jgi:methyl-accepting chemotaxis protein